MKDILTCTFPSLMAKIGSLKKEKNVCKRQTNLKSLQKLRSPEKIKKNPIKRQHGRRKNPGKKTSDKKVISSRKNNSKKKSIKGSKNEIPSKNDDLRKKRKQSQKSFSSKNIRDHVPSVEMQKMLSEHWDAKKLCNNPSTSLSQTARNPWLLKLDIPPQQTKPILNGVTTNGALPICSKSVIFIPKSNTVSGVILKRGASVPLVKKKERNNSGKILSTSKTPNGTTYAIAAEEVLQNGFGNSSSNNFNMKKKTEVNKSARLKSNPIVLSKKHKACIEEQKVSISRTINHNIQAQKTIEIENQQHGKNKTVANVASKSILINHQKEKSVIYKQVCLNTKALNTQVTKCHKKSNKRSKSIDSQAKKSNQSTNNKTLCLRNQAKVHPQRMASLDAMAKMHVICSTDRRVPAEVSKTSKHNLHTPQGKSNTKKIHVGIQKEVQEIKGRVIRSQINCVKFEESSSSVGTQNVRTYCSFSQEQEQTISKRPRGRPRLKPILEEQHSFKFNNIKQKLSKVSKKKIKQKTIKNVSKTHQFMGVKQNSKSKTVNENRGKKKIKSKVVNKKMKVKETIQMRKTCTFQSVTTVSSHKAVNSVLSSCSRLGVTTNFETKKTFVRDNAFEEKSNLRLEELQDPVMSSLGNSVVHVSNCCGHIHSSPHAIIPLAHSQLCHRYLGAEKPATTPHPYYNKGLPIHRCNHKEPVMYHHLSHDCGYSFDRDCCRSVGHGCCCSSSLLQSIHQPCGMTKESNLCTHNSYCHWNSIKCSSCCCCHNVSSAEHDFNLAHSSNFQKRCTCHESCRSSSPVYSQMNCSCPNVVRQYAPAPLVPFDQIPLDLSVGSPSTQSTEQSSDQSKIPCQTRYCQDHVHFQPCPQSYQYNPHCGYLSSNCLCYKGVCRERETSFNSNPVTDEHHTSHRIPILASISSCSNDDVSTDLICQEISNIHNSTFSSAKQEINNSSHLPIIKKRKFSHGWSWEGEPSERMIALTNDSIASPKRCYPALRHREGDIINERDCVLLKSGPKDTDLPYVAKIAAFWENPDDGEMMMSLLWYYRPEHTEQGKSGQMDDEVFASKHRDVNSVACIEDKCFVLTFNEYSRYRANLALNSTNAMSKKPLIVPQHNSPYLRQHRLPTGHVSPDMIFFCRHVYDFRQKRILKNPT